MVLPWEQDFTRWSLPLNWQDIQEDIVEDVTQKVADSSHCQLISIVIVLLQISKDYLLTVFKLSATCRLARWRPIRQLRLELALIEHHRKEAQHRLWYYYHRATLGAVDED